MATQKEIDASTQAEALLNSDVFKDAVKNLTAEYIAKWINSDVEKDQDLREAIYQAIKIIPEDSIINLGEYESISFSACLYLKGLVI